MTTRGNERRRALGVVPVHNSGSNGGLVMVGPVFHLVFFLLLEFLYISLQTSLMSCHCVNFGIEKVHLLNHILEVKLEDFHRVGRGSGSG